MARFEERPQQMSASLETGAADVADTLSRELARFSQAIGQERSEAVQRESIEAGVSAGLKGKTGKASEFTEAGQAFNKGMIAAFKAGLDNDARENISRIAQEYPDDVRKFDELAINYRDGVLQTVPDYLMDETQLNLDEQISRARVQVQGNTIQSQRNAVLLELQEGANNAASEAFKMARMGDTIAADRELEKVGEYVDSMDIDPTKKAEMMRAYKLENLEQNFKGQLDILYEQEGEKEALRWVSSLSGNYTRKDVTPDQWDSIVSQLQTDLSQKISIKNAIDNVNLNDARDDLKRYSEAKSLGFPVDLKEEMELTAKIEGTELSGVKKIIDNTAAFSVMSFDAREKLLAESKTGKLKDVDQFKAFVTANEKLNKMAREDAYTLAVSQGLIDEAPLDISNPDSFQVRIEQSKVVSNHYGVDASPLSAAEAQQLAANLDQMTSGEKIALATMLNQAPAVWGQLDDNNAGAFAMAGASGDARVMKPVFEGQEMLALKTVPPVSQKDYQMTFDEYTGDVYGIKDKRAVLDAALAHYAATSSAKGEYNEKEFKASLDAVTGGVRKVNGFKVELPRNVTDDQFEDYVDNMTPETLEGFGGVEHYEPEEALRIIRTSKIKSVGNNRYQVLNNGLTLKDKSGRPFTFTYDEEIAAEIKSESFFSLPSGLEEADLM